MKISQRLGERWGVQSVLIKQRMLLNITCRCVLVLVRRPSLFLFHTSDFKHLRYHHLAHWLLAGHTSLCCWIWMSRCSRPWPVEAVGVHLCSAALTKRVLVACKANRFKPSYLHDNIFVTTIQQKSTIPLHPDSVYIQSFFGYSLPSTLAATFPRRNQRTPAVI